MISSALTYMEIFRLNGHDFVYFIYFFSIYIFYEEIDSPQEENSTYFVEIYVNS